MTAEFSGILSLRSGKHTQHLPVPTESITHAALFLASARNKKTVGTPGPSRHAFFISILLQAMMMILMASTSKSSPQCLLFARATLLRAWVAASLQLDRRHFDNLPQELWFYRAHRIRSNLEGLYTSLETPKDVVEPDVTRKWKVYLKSCYWVYTFLHFLLITYSIKKDREVGKSSVTWLLSSSLLDGKQMW